LVKIKQGRHRINYIVAKIKIKKLDYLSPFIAIINATINIPIKLPKSKDLPAGKPIRKKSKKALTLKKIIIKKREIKI